MYDHERERLSALLEEAIRYADEKCNRPINGQYCGMMADHLLAHGVIALPPGVKPVVHAVREQICNQFLVTKETRIQWSEQATLCSEEKAERVAHEFIKDWDARWNRRAERRNEE